ncbi:MAG: SAM-dependent methyltransferase [Candidatus Rokuibacteriota bacterium]|nr:MAG: SAM-dependent methyltransferase [Candidatus Rokubacteria bacterium]
MKSDRPSATAHRVAMRRAAHQILDRPRVLDDPIALRIVGPRAEAAIRADPRRYQSRLGRLLRSFLVARSRVAEDALATAVAAGVRQYVVLGAGLDTFAYRNPYPAESLRVFEVDHPATQAWKRELLDRAGIPAPASLTFVPVDFETQALSERLRESGFRTEAPTFFSWLGVTMYLTRETVMATLAFVAGGPPGCGITFDYLIPPASLPLLRRIGFLLLAHRLKAAGEPWRTWFDPTVLARDLRELGFTQLEDLDAATLDARYFDGGEGPLGGRSVAHVMTAKM